MAASPWFLCQRPLAQTQAAHFILNCIKLPPTPREAEVSNAKQEQHRAEPSSAAAQQFPALTAAWLCPAAPAAALCPSDRLTPETPSLLVLLGAERAPCWCTEASPGLPLRTCEVLVDYMGCACPRVPAVPLLTDPLPGHHPTSPSSSAHTSWKQKRNKGSK